MSFEKAMTQKNSANEINMSFQKTQIGMNYFCWAGNSSISNEMIVQFFASSFEQNSLGPC